MVSDRDRDIPLSKKGQRTMSDFLAKELLYDYLAERLDPDRRECVEDCLNASAELGRDFARLTAASRYAKILADTHIDPSVLTAIDEPETYLSVALKKSNYQKWPLAVRWGTEAALVLMALIIVLIVIPWQKVLRMGLSPRGREIILAEVHRNEGIDRTQLAGDDGPAQPDEEAAEVATKDGSAAHEGETTRVATTPSAKPITLPLMGNLLPAPAPTPVETGKGKPANAKAVVAKPSKPATEKVAANETESPATDDGSANHAKRMGEGALYRTILSVEDVNTASPEIRDKIVELGGKKAGEVELGWKKTPTSSYFHFTLPEDKYDEFAEFLANYGDVDIVKEKHPRIMPAGTLRLIITVDEGKE